MRRFHLLQSSTLTAEEKSASLLLELSLRLRVAEKLLLGYLAYTVAAAFIHPLSFRERLTVLVLNLAASAMIIALARYAEIARRELLATIRDWLPCILILLAYRESGLFFRPDPTHCLDYLFLRWDNALLHHPRTLVVLEVCSPWLQRYLEFSYFLCYPLVPMGLACLYPTARKAGCSGGSLMDDFWTTVLLATLVCYVVYPLFPLTPPRELFHDLPGGAVAPLLRRGNFWVLGQYGVGASLFPSGHVAAVTATALVVRAYRPRLGVLFVVVAASIAAATIYGRYHYAADALAGALVGLAAYCVSGRIRRFRQHGRAHEKASCE